MAVIDELLIGLGFEYDSKEAKKFKKDVGDTVNVVNRLAKAAVGAATAITAMTVASTRASDEQGKLADEIGETVENVGALQFAQQIAGGTADGMANSLRELSLRASEAARGTGTAVEAFGLLGISATGANDEIKSANSLMQEISASFQGLGRARQIELADKLGLRDSIRLLQMGPEAIGDLTEQAMALGVTTARDAELSASFNDSLVEMWSVTKQVARVLSRSFAPVLEDIVDGLTEWWIANRRIIEQKIPEFIDTFTKAIKLLTIAMGIWLAMRIVTHLITLITLMKGLTVATLAANAGFFLLPIILGTLAAAFVALMQDAHVFFEGGESFIGDMLDKYPQWAEELNTVAAVMATIYDVTMMIFEGWGMIFDLFKSDTSVEDIKDVFKNIPGFLGDITGLSTVEGTGFIPETSERISNVYESTSERISNAYGSTSERISNTYGATVEKIDIIVQGGADTAENIANRVYEVFQQTYQDLTGGVDQ